MAQMADQVFRRVEEDNQKHDMHTFNILLAIDGTRSVGSIAQEDHYDLEDLAKVIQQLVASGSIEPVVMEYSDSMRDAFFKGLEAQLSQIMGPVSGIILEENVSQLGVSIAGFPMNKASELIQLISRNIPDKQQSEAFIRQMNDMLNQ